MADASTASSHSSLDFETGCHLGGLHFWSCTDKQSTSQSGHLSIMQKRLQASCACKTGPSKQHTSASCSCILQLHCWVASYSCSQLYVCLESLVHLRFCAGTSATCPYFNIIFRWLQIAAITVTGVTTGAIRMKVPDEHLCACMCGPFVLQHATCNHTMIRTARM